MPKQQFQLRVKIELIPCDPHGNPMWGNPLNLSEDMTISADGFMEVAAILGQFHELNQQLQAKESENT